MSLEKHTGFSVKRLNNEKVGEVPWKKPRDTRPVRGFKLFPEMNANIFLCAKKKSGKTSTIYKILQKCCGKDTKIIAFCATLHKDQSWIAIKEWADDHGISFTGYTSLKDDDGVDQLLALVKELENEVDTRSDSEEKQKRPNGTFSVPDTWAEMCIAKEKEPAKKRAKYQTPEYIFILDDLSTELKSTSIPRLLKVNRHFLSKTLLSSQWLNDLHPGSRKQMDYFILFRGHSKKKIEEIHRDASISIPLETFYSVYKFATEKPFSFLYVDCTEGTFRRNFDEEINVPCSDSDSD